MRIKPGKKIEDISKEKLRTTKTGIPISNGDAIYIISLAIAAEDLL